jgi:hypothetical protein
MKNTLELIVATTVLLVAGLVSVNGQTNNFGESALDYFTSINTNYCWTNSAFGVEVGTGYKQVGGVNEASTFDIQKDLDRFNIGGAFQFSGVGSPLNAAEGQLGYAVIEYYDLKVDFNVRAGYDWNVEGIVIEPGIFLKKKGTLNTFFETGISFPVYLTEKFNNTPTFYFQTGFTF